MAKVDYSKNPQLVEAVLVWTGWESEIMPRRDDSSVIRRFGVSSAADLLPIVKGLADEFDASEARYNSSDLAEMGELASDDFRRTHPGISEEIVEALAWCYTFDNR